MDIAASASIMLDEASDIQMHKHLNLNVFVNVSCAAKYFLCNFFISMAAAFGIPVYMVGGILGVTRQH
jgi:hypothetical protein